MRACVVARISHAQGAKEAPWPVVYAWGFSGSGRLGLELDVDNKLEMLQIRERNKGLPPERTQTTGPKHLPMRRVSLLLLASSGPWHWSRPSSLVALRPFAAMASTPITDATEKAAKIVEASKVLEAEATTEEVKSYYWWEGKVNFDPEWRVALKTAAAFSEVEDVEKLVAKRIVACAQASATSLAVKTVARCKPLVEAQAGQAVRWTSIGGNAGYLNLSWQIQVRNLVMQVDAISIYPPMKVEERWKPKVRESNQSVAEDAAKLDEPSNTWSDCQRKLFEEKADCKLKALQDRERQVKRMCDGHLDFIYKMWDKPDSRSDPCEYELRHLRKELEVDYIRTLHAMNLDGSGEGPQMENAYWVKTDPEIKGKLCKFEELVWILQQQPVYMARLSAALRKGSLQEADNRTFRTMCERIYHDLFQPRTVHLFKSMLSLIIKSEMQQAKFLHDLFDPFKSHAASLFTQLSTHSAFVEGMVLPILNPQVETSLVSTIIRYTLLKRDGETPRVLGTEAAEHSHVTGVFTTHYPEYQELVKKANADKAAHPGKTSQKSYLYSFQNELADLQRACGKEPATSGHDSKDVHAGCITSFIEHFVMDLLAEDCAKDFRMLLVCAFKTMLNDCPAAKGFEESDPRVCTPLASLVLGNIIGSVLETVGHRRYSLVELSIRKQVLEMFSNMQRRKGRPKGDLEVDPNDVAAGGDISNKKTFTFGDACIQGKLNPAYQHSLDFKIVGGSFKSQASVVGPTQVEEERLAKWKGTITRLKHAPLHWQRKAKMLVATQSQAVYAQGTHTFQADEEELKKVRSTIMRTMWQADCYSMSPYVTFALLLPAQLDPLFGHKYHGLRTLARCMRQHDFAVEMRIKRFLACNGHERNGPTIRLRQLYDDPVYRTAVHELLTDPELEEERWAHDLREMWRSRLWSLVSTERSQHYCDVHEVDVDRTMQYHNELRQLASQTNPDGDEGLEYEGPIGDARARLSVLRRLFAGGLLTNERTARHKRQTGAKPCDCGAQQAVLHVSWECPLYANDRVPFTAMLTENVDALPVCTKYAGIIPIAGLESASAQAAQARTCLQTSALSSASDVMLGRLIPFALIAQCNAYARVSIPVTGQVMGGESFEIHAEMMKEVHSGLGKLEVLGECCADPGEASEVSDAINSNQVYGKTKEVDKEIFKVGSTACRQMREFEQKNQANKACSYFFVFENTKHADHGYAANCVPAQMCKELRQPRHRSAL
eukprot:s833_g4.t4